MEKSLAGFNAIMFTSASDLRCFVLQKRLIECLQWVIKMVMDESKMVACSMPSLLQQNFNLHVYKLPTMLQPTSSRLIRKHFTLCYAVNLIFRRFIIGKFTCMQ